MKRGNWNRNQEGTSSPRRAFDPDATAERIDDALANSETHSRAAMSDQADHLSRHAVARYLIALGAVAAAFALRVLLTPLTGTGAPFVLFFAAVMVTSLYVGSGPGLVALVTSLPIAAYMFVVRAGYPVDQAVFQALCTRSTGSSSFTSHI